MLDDIYRDSDAKMGKALEATRTDFASIRTGRASPSLLDRLHVEAYGKTQPLKAVASVNSPDGRSLLVTPFDKSNIAAIRKAIDEVKALGKDHTITDDQVKRGQDQVQKQTDKYIKQIDDLVGGKEKEIMEV